MEFKNRSANYVEKVVAFIAHAGIPDLRIGFPGITGELVGVICHGSCFTIKKKCSLMVISGRITGNS